MSRIPASLGACQEGVRVSCGRGQFTTAPTVACWVLPLLTGHCRRSCCLRLQGLGPGKPLRAAGIEEGDLGAVRGHALRSGNTGAPLAPWLVCEKLNMTDTVTSVSLATEDPPASLNVMTPSECPCYYHF